jgi:hypothetical protein
MTTIIDTLPTVQYLAGTSVRKSTPKTNIVINDNDTLIDQLSIRHEETRLIHSNGMKLVPVSRKIYFCDSSGTIE